MKYTDPVPLRKSTAWGTYQSDDYLPLVYGRVRATPLRYRADEYRLLLADHAIQGVDAVTLRGAAYSAWTLSQETDATGHPVAVLNVQHRADPGDWAVTLRGKQHPDTGILLDRPDQILADLLGRICGISQVNAERLDDLRTLGDLIGPVGGVISEPTSLQSTVDEICAGCGLAWGPTVSGLALLWPPTVPALEPAYRIEDTLTPSLSAATDEADLATLLRLDYARDWSTGDCSASLVAEATDAMARLGMIEARLQATWLQSHGAAEALSRRWLAWHASPRWTIQAALPHTQLGIGDYVGLTHRLSPISGGWLTGLSMALAGDTVTIVGGPPSTTPVAISRAS